MIPAPDEELRACRRRPGRAGTPRGDRRLRGSRPAGREAAGGPRPGRRHPGRLPPDLPGARDLDPRGLVGGRARRPDSPTSTGCSPPRPSPTSPPAPCASARARPTATPRSAPVPAPSGRRPRGRTSSPTSPTATARRRRSSSAGPASRQRDNIGVLSIPSITRRERRAARTTPSRRDARSDADRRTASAGASSRTPTRTSSRPPRTGSTARPRSAMMDTTGRVPAGRVDDGLLMRDPAAPFGLRLDRDAVDAVVHQGLGPRASATSCWSRPRTSPAPTPTEGFASARPARGDAARRAARDRQARRPAAPPRRSRARRGARGRARTTARCAGRSRSPPSAGRASRPGSSSTGTTRRTGFVQIVDVAPTVLRLLGIDRPEEMEGRPVRRRSRAPTPYPERVKTLIQANRAAVFRDNNIGKATAALRHPDAGPRWRRADRLPAPARGRDQVLEVAALAVLGFLVAHVRRRPAPLVQVVGRPRTSGLPRSCSRSSTARSATRFGRRHPADALLLGLGGMMAAAPARRAQRGPARVQHRVRVHADDRDPARRARQPGLGAGLRVRAAVRRAARVAGRRPDRPPDRGRGARRHGRRRRRAVLRPGLRRRDLAPRPPTSCSGCCSTTGRSPRRPSRCSRSCSSAPASRSGSSTSRARRQPDPRRPVLREGRRRGDLGLHDRRRPQALAHARDVPQHRLGAARGRRRSARSPTSRGAPTGCGRSPARCRRSAPRSSRSRCWPSSARCSTTPASRSWG